MGWRRDERRVFRRARLLRALRGTWHEPAAQRGGRGLDPDPPAKPLTVRHRQSSRWPRSCVLDDKSPRSPETLVGSFAKQVFSLAASGLGPGSSCWRGRSSWPPWGRGRRGLVSSHPLSPPPHRGQDEPPRRAAAAVPVSGHAARSGYLMAGVISAHKQAAGKIPQPQVLSPLMVEPR